MTEERMQSDGAIYTNNYKDNEKQPDWTGKVVLDKNLLKALVEKVKSGQEQRCVLLFGIEFLRMATLTSMLD